MSGSNVLLQEVECRQNVLDEQRILMRNLQIKYVSKTLAKKQLRLDAQVL